MKRLISLSLVLTLAACNTEPVNPPGNDDGERTLCDDGSRYSFLDAQTIEFGKSYELSSGRVWFRVVADRPTRVTLRLDNLPDYGLLNYSVLDGVQQTIFGDSLGTENQPIPASLVRSGEVTQNGAVFVLLEHINFDLNDTRCPKFQFTLFKE